MALYVVGCGGFVRRVVVIGAISELAHETELALTQCPGVIPISVAIAAFVRPDVSRW